MSGLRGLRGRFLPGKSFRRHSGKRITLWVRWFLGGHDRIALLEQIRPRFTENQSHPVTPERHPFHEKNRVHDHENEALPIKVRTGPLKGGRT